MRGCVAGKITPPCSKSYLQRALACSLLADGCSSLKNVDFCNDTLSALECIRTLGAEVVRSGERALAVRGRLAPQSDTLDVGESGLAARLFTPVVALCDRPIVVRGKGSLLHRPMDMMTGPLRRLGVDVRDGGGRLPIEVCGPVRGGEIEVDGSISSQFVTGLLLALPMAAEDTTIHVDGAVSKPYIDMTVDTAGRFGVEISHNDYTEFYIAGGQRYKPADYALEGDWSAAATMLVAGAVAGEVTLENMSPLSRQADVAIIEALVRAGAYIVNDGNSITAAKRELTAFEFDATDCPDLFPALAALAAAAEGESVIVGTSRLEHKESNRAETLRSEYAKLGIGIDLSTDNVMRIRGGEIASGVTLESHNDHRIAMSLAVSALRCGGALTIRDAECVSKSYPEFFNDLDRLTVKK